jgi:deazaflavin-dependent oxidoreductase (nitroreductase family)
LAQVRRLLLIGAVIAAGLYFGTALFERVAPRRWVKAYQRNVNPLQFHAAGFTPGWAVVETTGRRTGQPRRVPVGGALRGDSWWLVAGDAGHSHFVRNIEADPSVRVRVHGRWRNGTAHPIPEDDPRRRLLRLNPLNSPFVWIAGRDLLTLRIDLEPCP